MIDPDCLQLAIYSHFTVFARAIFVCYSYLHKVRIAARDTHFSCTNRQYIVAMQQ